MSKTSEAVAIILGTIIGLVFLPMGLIWAIDTLFQLEIPITLKTWFAAAIIMLFVRYLTSKQKD